MVAAPASSELAIETSIRVSGPQFGLQCRRSQSGRYLSALRPWKWHYTSAIISQLVGRLKGVFIV